MIGTITNVRYTVRFTPTASQRLSNGIDPCVLLLRQPLWGDMHDMSKKTDFMCVNRVNRVNRVKGSQTRFTSEEDPDHLSQETPNKEQGITN